MKRTRNVLIAFSPEELAFLDRATLLAGADGSGRRRAELIRIGALRLAQETIAAWENAPASFPIPIGHNIVGRDGDGFRCSRCNIWQPTMQELAALPCPGEPQTKGP